MRDVFVVGFLFYSFRSRRSPVRVNDVVVVLVDDVSTFYGRRCADFTFYI